MVKKYVDVTTRVAAAASVQEARTRRCWRCNNGQDGVHDRARYEQVREGNKQAD